MIDLIPCPYCFNGSTDPLICSHCGQLIGDVVEDDECSFRIPFIGVLKIYLKDSNVELRRALLEMISEHISIAEQFEDMTDTKHQLSMLSENDYEFCFRVRDHIAEAIIEKMSSNNSFRKINCNFIEQKTK